jgi:membrane-bound ClpP family serine protease
MVWGISLILLGLVLLMLEVFIPSGGLILILALTAMVSGVVMIFYTPESQGGGTTAGLVTLVVLVVLTPVVGMVALYLWPRTPVGKMLRLAAAPEDATLAARESVLELEQYRGQIGKTLTPHQPSGQTEIAGKRLDSTSEGRFLEAGQFVKVVAIHNGHLIVRPVGGEIGDLPDEPSA